MMLLPTGGPLKDFAIGTRTYPVSFIDAANPCVFVDAAQFDMTGQELPQDIAAASEVMDVLEKIRLAAGRDWDDWSHPHPVFRDSDSVPKFALVGPPSDSKLLSGETLSAGDCDVQVRMGSMGKPHLAIPLTGAMCTAVAARIPGTVVADLARQVPDEQPLRIGTPSGVVPAQALVQDHKTGWTAVSASVFRTARTLMQGTVFAHDAENPP